MELARSGCRVLYVDSLGLRPPSLGGRDVRRLARRLWRGLGPPRQVRPGLWVWSPLALPWPASPLAQLWNRLVLRFGLALAARGARLSPRTLWTYSPLAADVLHLQDFSRVVYHAVDDIAVQPGMPAALIRRAEGELVRRADVVFATSPSLQARHAAAGARRSIFLPNVADPDHFGAALAPGARPPPDLAALPEPRIAFVGAVSGYKLDFALLARGGRGAAGLQLRADRAAGRRRSAQ